jgi:hypothetical protein
VTIPYTINNSRASFLFTSDSLPTNTTLVFRLKNIYVPPTENITDLFFVSTSSNNNNNISYYDRSETCTLTSLIPVYTISSSFALSRLAIVKSTISYMQLVFS